MGKFDQRSHEPEMMDQAHPDETELKQNLRELVHINRLTGGISTSLEGVKRLMPPAGQPVHVADIGCGAGDFLAAMHQKYQPPKYKITLTGVDLHPEMLDFARHKFPQSSDAVEWKPIGYQALFDQGFQADIIVAGLFCHHLSDKELPEFLAGAYKAARRGIVINDLERHPLAYYSIKTLTRLFSRSTYTRYDAPLSVLRAFKKEELEKNLKKAGIPSFKVEHHRAFRLLTTAPKK